MRESIPVLFEVFSKGQKQPWDATLVMGARPAISSASQDQDIKGSGPSQDQDSWNLGRLRPNQDQVFGGGGETKLGPRLKKR